MQICRELLIELDVCVLGKLLQRCACHLILALTRIQFTLRVRRNQAVSTNIQVPIKTNLLAIVAQLLTGLAG